MKRVEEIVKIVSPKKVEGPVTSVVSHITADSRTVQEGDYCTKTSQSTR